MYYYYYTKKLTDAPRSGSDYTGTPSYGQRPKRPAEHTPSPQEGETRRPLKRMSLNTGSNLGNTTPEATAKWTEVLGRRQTREARKGCGNPANTVSSKPVDQPGKPGCRRRKKQRAEAFLIKPADGKGYADVLRIIRTSVNPAEHDVDIKGIRKTRSGDVLVEIEANAENKTKFGCALSTAVGESSCVRPLKPKSMVENRDLDAATEETELRAALEALCGGEGLGEPRINLSRENKWGSIMAFVELDEHLAEKLVQAGRLKVGWVNCRVRSRAWVSRCFRCHGYGHTAADCKAADRTNLCWRCGTAGHKAVVCTKVPKCCLCVEASDAARTDHTPGSLRCKVYQAALRKAKSTSH